MSRRVAINAVWNLFGVGLPVLAGIAAVPMLLHGLGATRLGVFSLAMGLFGFAGVFDFGLGRALTQTVASERGKGSTLAAIAGLVRLGLAAVLVLGAAWGTALWLLAPTIVTNLFHLQGNLATETIDGIRWLAFALPVILVSTSLIGVLEGLQCFRSINLLRAPVGVATFLVPAVIAQVSNDLSWVIAGMAITRIAGSVLWALMVFRFFPLFKFSSDQSLSAAPMWRFTGWLAISNLVSPIMVHADRYYLASVFPPSVVAQYTVPLDALLRAMVFPSSAINAAFPALAHSGGADEKRAVQGIIRNAGWFIMFIWFLPILAVGVMLPLLLTMWLGPDFGQKIVTISQWILSGILVNGFAYIPYSYLQSAGRSDWTAKLHVLELPLYAVALVYLVGEFGVVGAAMAWFGRVLLDAVAMFAIAMTNFATVRTALAMVASGGGGALLLLSCAFVFSVN